MKGEYKEIMRVITNTLKCIKKYGFDGAYEYIKKNQPKEYTIQTADNPKGGKGHEMFFRDKLYYINKRYLALTHEMERRGYKPNWEMVYSILGNALQEIVDNRFWNDYTPTPEAYELNLKRRKEMGHYDQNKS